MVRGEGVELTGGVGNSCVELCADKFRFLAGVGM